jgi:hypothetical protein
MKRRGVVARRLAGGVSFGVVSLLGHFAEAACPGPVAGWSTAEIARVDNSAGATARPHYYALITVNTASWISAGTLRADGGDLRVTDGACNPLDFWVESGLDTTSTKIWVDTPLTASVSELRVHHGNPTATRTNRASDVFGAGIATLFTFTEGSGTVLHDWVGGRNLQIGAGPLWTTGFRPGTNALQNFTTGRVYAAPMSGPAVGSGAFSTFVMLNPTASDRSGRTSGVFGNYAGDGSPGWVLKFQGGAGQMMLLTSAGPPDYCQFGRGTVVAGEWQLVGARRDPASANAFFQNGVQQGTTFCAGDSRNVDNAAGTFELGRSYNGGYAYGGAISFASVFTRALTDAEIAQLHISLRPPTIPVTSAVTRGTAPAITSANTARFVVTQAGTFTVTATGNPAPAFAIATGTLPNGLTLAANGTLSGTPALGTVGKYAVTVRATNGLGSPANQLLSLDVVKAAQTIAFPAIPDGAFDATPPALAATASSKLAVAFTSSTPSVCTVAGNALTFVSAGACTVVANQAGNADYEAAPPATRTFAIVAAPASAPTHVVATPGDSMVTFTFGPPADTGGAAVSGYSVSCVPANIDAGADAGAGHVASGAQSPLTVTGLTNGTPYRCSVIAETSGGPGEPLVLDVTPVAPPEPDAGLDDAGTEPDGGRPDVQDGSVPLPDATPSIATGEGDSGCGCVTVPSSVRSPAAFGLAATLAALLGRRRARPRPSRRQ